VFTGTATGDGVRDRANSGLEERDELEEELLLIDFPSSLSSLPNISSKSSAAFCASFLRCSWATKLNLYDIF
jgi:hypothetical protein